MKEIFEVPIGKNYNRNKKLSLLIGMQGGVDRIYWKSCELTSKCKVILDVFPLPTSRIPPTRR